MTLAIKSLKNQKSPGPDGLPAEVFKFGGYLLKRKLHKLFRKVWSTGIIPQDWKDSLIIALFKKKGSKSVCDNYRGISLLAVAGKILARIMLARLAKLIAECVLPETQCGFRKERRTTDNT